MHFRNNVSLFVYRHLTLIGGSCLKIALLLLGFLLKNYANCALVTFQRSALVKQAPVSCYQLNPSPLIAWDIILSRLLFLDCNPTVVSMASHYLLLWSPEKCSLSKLWLTSIPDFQGRGTRAVFQFYPENEHQSALIMTQATKAGFNGGLVVDYPNSVKAKK